MNNLNSKEALETEHSKLDYIINQIQKITSKYCSIQTDEVRVNKAPKISIEQDVDGPNLNLSAVANKPVAEAYFSPLEPHKRPPWPDHLKPKSKFQQSKLDNINKTLDFEIQKLERKINNKQN